MLSLIANNADLIFSVGGFLFIVALLPSLFSNHKPAFWTSVETSLILYTFAWTYYSLDLYFSSLTTAITAILWAVLAAQKGRK